VSAIGPAITSFNLASNEANGSFAGTNNDLTFSFNANEQINVLSVTIDGHPVEVSGSGSGPFSASYAMQSTDPTQSIPVNITIADNDNDQTSVSFTYAANTSPTVSGSGAAVISSIVSNANTAGVLTNGNSITFTLTPLNPEPNAHINGSYNGVPLSWATTNGGVNYVATYVVASGQASQPVPLQLSGVTLTDQNGNVSAPASGYDIQKTISVTDTGTATVTTTPVITTTGTTTSVSTEIQSLESQLAQLQAQEGTSSNSTVGFDFTEFLGIGSQDAQVTALQNRLTTDGFYSGPITGFFGTQTQAAVEKFQAAHGIEQVGYVGSGTRAALNAGD
jgi:hypothetical protein